ncbi:MAG: B12-binding domain-containing radical SAM protein [Flavobacterium sp.]|uniref:B12-binding domain-containing radical SAM protein n=2 Tax=Flavobacterium sp. TaxID=239 RepID=UPI0022C1A2F9|nr:B12-binding domain-containing radical SAM protein [Flavobacterium sp.]MCZ8169625.1 B12-binding domain-containing radical SAM protein [Flavobacterium sp.]MCZ8296466.1 B12-binding domain-containing radical SAM protein [Flavobacterium sp.]
MAALLLITPPFTQLNTPYPATAYLKGFLTTRSISSYQMDLGLEVVLDLFSPKGLTAIFEASERQETRSENAQRIYQMRSVYIQTIAAVVGFLQGKQPNLARQICSGNFLPEASRFSQLDDLEWAFGAMGLQDKAKHLATLYLEDVSDFIVECVDSNFGFSRYAERLGRSANSFDLLYEALQQAPTFVDEFTVQRLAATMQREQPDLVCFSVPFPGNLYSAFRCAQWIKSHYPNTKIAMGGGFPNTELRQLTDSRVFDFLDYITLDDGERPIELLYANLQLPAEQQVWKRTYLREAGEVVYKNDATVGDYKQTEVGTPDYSDLLLTEYLSVIEIANPMHSLWSDGRWNKLTMAHGCYWGKCTFCDISLDYIKVYEPIHARMLVDRMETLIAQTGESGFHFVDEAAPPALMRELALEILRRNLVVTWWTNIRFEKSFTRDLCLLLKASGCIAVSGGLEVASDRLLALIQKGVTVAQVAQVTRNFTESGIMVHAYLMYGYPTQTVQETIDSLEMVRQLFSLGIVQSGFWHQFALTAHSPIGLDPEAYGIIPQKQAISFAHNDIEFTDQTGINHDRFSYGLRKSLFNYMHGLCLDDPLQNWFDFKIPPPKVSPNFIVSALDDERILLPKSTAKIIWGGLQPECSSFQKQKKGKTWPMLHVRVHALQGVIETVLPELEGRWLIDQIKQLTPSHPQQTWGALQKSFEMEFEDFALFWTSKGVLPLREMLWVL